MVAVFEDGKGGGRRFGVGGWEGVGCSADDGVELECLAGASGASAA